MPKSASHRRAQRRAAGRGGKTEVRIPGTRMRLDALTKGGKRATEVERSGDARRIAKAVTRVKASPAPSKVIQVPQKDMGKAMRAMNKQNVSGTVKDMSGAKYWSTKQTQPRGRNKPNTRK